MRKGKTAARILLFMSDRRRSWVRDLLRTIPVTDGDNHPTISARFPQRFNHRTMRHTTDHRRPTVKG